MSKSTKTVIPAQAGIQNARGVVPRLRFPEFRDAGQWRETQLGELGEFTGGGTPSKSNDSFWKGSIPWVSSSDISEDSIHEIRISRFITEEALKSSATKLVPKGSVLLVSRVGVGKLAITKSAVCTSQDFTSLTPYNDKLEFLGYLLKANAHALERLGQGMAIKGFTKEDITKLTVYLPELEEQQKIADCLSSLDALIAAQADKVDALKTHKEGLMQQLFPREGEIVPRLRFPEFRDAGEWGETTLGQIVDIRSGYSPSRYNLSGNAQYAFLKVEDLNNCEKYQTSSREFSDDILGLVPADSIIFPKRGAAILNNKVRLNTVEVLMDTNLMAITPKREVLAEFLYCIVVTEGLSKIADTSTIPQINNKHITPYVVRLPGKAEQQEIANCLSSLDALIAAHTEKLDALKAHKKGLIQQLFPSPAEIAV